MTGPITLSASDADAPVIQLGLACGLFRATPGDAGVYEIDPDWFEDPVGKSGSGLTDNPETLAKLIAELIGGASGSSLGIPVKEPGTLGTWYPINKPGTTEPSGLYLATQPTASAGNGATQPPTVFGVGVMYTKTVALDAAEKATLDLSLAGPDSIDIRVWELIPVVLLGDGSVEVVAGSADHPFTIGFEVAGSGELPLVTAAGLSFGGVRASLNLSPLGDPPVSVSLVVLQLKLPTDAEPSDRTLADLQAITGAEILATAAALAVGALGKLIGDAPSLDYLLPALGLGPHVPGLTEVTLPILRWDQFVGNAIDGGNLAQPFIDWFTALASDGALLSAWLQAVGGAIGGISDTAPEVSGAGSREDPYKVAVFAVDKAGTLELTCGTATDANGVRHFYPGLGFSSDAIVLGSSDVALTGIADIEFLDFALCSGGTAVAPGQFRAGLALANKTPADPLFSGEIAGGSYTFGAFTAGLSVLIGTDGATVLPVCALVGVTTPTGAYPSIDLTQPGSLVEVAEQELTKAISNAFNELFGLDQDSKAGAALATLIGIAPPDGQGANWPASLTPPFSVAALVNTVQDPVGALSAYWAGLIRGAEPVDGKPPFYYMVEALGTVLQEAGGGGVTGAGTASDPWAMDLGAGAGDAVLLASIADGPSAGTRRLVIGIGATTDMPVAGNSLTAAFHVDLLGLDAGAGSTDGLVGAQILPGVGFVGALPQGVSTPEVAGALLKVDSASLSVSWSPYSSWAWSMSVAAPTLVVDGTPEPVGSAMTYSDSDGLEKLVKDEAATFASILTGVLGVALYRAEKRAGLVLDGWLGLLPNLAPFVPKGIDWPAGMPSLKPASFDDPIGQLRAQVKAVLGSDANARAALGLLGWAIDGSSAAAAPIAGTGTSDDPYLVPLGLPGGILGSLWQDDNRTMVVPGLATRQTATKGGVTADTTVRLDPVAIGWSDGRPIDGAGRSSITLTTVLSGANGPLVTLNGTAVETVTLGVVLALDLSGPAPAFSAQPLVSATLKDAANGVSALALGDGLDVAGSSALMGWVNAGIAQAAAAFEADETFILIYEVLSGLGLAVPANGAVGSRGINPGGWQALLADPLGYLNGVLRTALSDLATQADLFAALSKVLGISLPEVPEPLLALLAGLGLVTDADHGYAPNPQAIITLLRRPATELPRRVSALVASPAARSAVVAALAKGSQTLTFGPLQVDAANGRQVTLSLPRGSFAVGEFIDPSLSLQIDVLTGVLSITQDLYLPDAGFGLSTGLSYAGSGAPAVAVSLTWGDGQAPQPAAMTLFPFDQSAFIDQLAAVGPAYVLSIFVAEVVEDRLLAKYPVAQVLLELFGLASEDPETKAWRMKSTLGLFEDPVGWLLSDAVVGADGRLNIATLNKALTGLPGGTVAGLTLAPASDGVLLNGLPYGLQVAATASTTTGLFSLTPGLGKPMSIAGGDVTLDALTFGLSLTADFQPGLSGSGRIVVQIPGLDGGLFVAGGYASGFALTLGQVGDGKPTLDLVPFASWQPFVLALAAEMAQKLLQTLTDQLLTALKAKGDTKLAEFVDKLRATAVTLQIDTLVSALIAAQPDTGKLETAAFDWLNQRLTPANAAATATAVADLLSLALSGAKADGGLLYYTPSPSVPITVMAGLRGETGAQEIGIWATLSVKIADDHIVIGLAPTGLGIPVQGAATPRVAFGLVVQAVVANGEGPGLTVSFDSAQGATVAASIDPMMSAAKPSDLSLVLLPELFNIPPGTPNYDDKLKEKLETWLLGVLKYVLPRYVSIVVLNTSTVETWLDEPLTKTVPLVPGTVLVDTKLLIKSGDTYILNDLDSLAALGVEGFLAGLLKALTETQIQVLAFESGGGIWLEPNPGSASEYGIRFAITDLSLKQAPNFVFQLGAENKDWITLTGADADDYESGIAAYVPITNGSPEFAGTKLRLINVGVDFQGKADKPLVDLSRFKIGKVKPRGLITFDFAAQDVVQAFGGGIEVEDIAISLAPNEMVEGPKSNPVAQNLLGSGDDAKDENPAANPAFSARAAWISGHDLGVQLYDSSGSSTTEIWIPVQRSFGPVHANKIGLGWDNPDRRASVLFDGGLSLAGLSVDLVDLSVSVKVTEITDYSQYALDLGGLSISFEGGAVEIAGGLLKQADPLRYDGMLLVKAASFTLYAVGSFALIPVDPDKPSGSKAVSCFIFLNLNAPLGGVPAFFINGVAGGFSINRNIIIPDAGDIMGFPLIQGAISNSTFGDDPSPADALGVLSKVVYPEIGTYWGAAGLKFSSFELLDVFAMLLVKFGREFEIDVIGVASASLPPEVPTAEALAYIELAIVASFKFTQGEISVTAQLTPNSFLLDKDCKLTGGFAAKFWFGPNPNAGNFVITLGGYHPAFTPPDFYPLVPRLGFNWPILDTSSMKIGVSGGTYFALTPAMFMAGGYLKASFSAGPLKAWFDAGADFLISWQPFYYSAEVHISVGASLGVTIAGVDVTLTAELGARLDLWGPPTAGMVHVSWFVISFEIPIGDQDQDAASSKSLNWDQFQSRLLPQPSASQSKAMLAATVDAPPPPTPGFDQVVLKVQVTNGLLENDAGDGPVVQSMPFTLEVRSVIPASKVGVAESTFAATSPPLGIQPMNQTDVTTELAVTLETRNDANDWIMVSIDRDGLVAAGLPGAASAALWTTEAFDPNGKPGADPIPGVAFGMSLSGTGDNLFDVLAAMNLLTAFGYEHAAALPLPFDLTPSYPVPDPLPQTNRFATLMSTVMDTGPSPSAPAAVRAGIMQLLEDSAVAVIVDQNLSVLASFADIIFQAPPSLAAMGFDQAGVAAPIIDLAASPPAAVGLFASPGPEELPPRYLGGAQAYAVAKPARARGGSIYLSGPRIVARWVDADAARGAARAAALDGSDERGAGTGLRHGAIAMFDAGRGRGRPHFQLDGRLPVRVYAFDASERILSDELHADHSPDTPIALPEATTGVVCVGAGAAGDGAPQGWNLHSTLFQVGHHTLLGDGCTIRAQNSPRVRRGMREQRRGPVSGEALVRRNHVQDGIGRTEPGWTETVFANTVRTVAVVVEAGAGTATPRVKLAVTDSPWRVEYAAPAEHHARFEVADGIVYLFATGADGGDGAEGLRHGVLVASGAALAGVYGWQDDPDAVREGWDGHRLRSLARPVLSPADRMPAVRAAAVAPAGETAIRLFRG